MSNTRYLKVTDAYLRLQDTASQTKYKKIEHVDITDKVEGVLEWLESEEDQHGGDRLIPHSIIYRKLREIFPQHQEQEVNDDET